MLKLKGSQHFTKLDIRWGYNNVQIKGSDRWKAAFVTNRGLFKPNVMFLGITMGNPWVQNQVQPTPIPTKYPWVYPEGTVGIMGTLPMKSDSQWV